MNLFLYISPAIELLKKLKKKEKMATYAVIDRVPTHSLFVHEILLNELCSSSKNLSLSLLLSPIIFIVLLPCLQSFVRFLAIRFKFGAMQTMPSLIIELRKIDILKIQHIIPTWYQMALEEISSKDI